ncbi:MAG: hypothetical protein AB1609_11620, partial [Bacillota bacterium]
MGYWQGTGTPAGGQHNSEADPGKMYPGTAFFRPLFILNYSEGNGVADIDYLIVEWKNGANWETVYSTEDPGLNVPWGQVPLKARKVSKESVAEITDGLTAGTTYYVRVMDYDTSGNASAASAQVSAVAGKAQTTDIAFRALSSFASVFKTEADIITVAGGNQPTPFVTIPDLSITVTLQAGDVVMQWFRASVWVTYNGYSTDCRLRVLKDGAELAVSNVLTRHTSATADSTGQVAHVYKWDITASGTYTFEVQWRCTSIYANTYSGMASRAHLLTAFRGDETGVYL